MGTLIIVLAGKGQLDVIGVILVSETNISDISLIERTSPRISGLEGQYGHLARRNLNDSLRYFGYACDG
jgi:hypothetical protein